MENLIKLSHDLLNLASSKGMKLPVFDFCNDDDLNLLALSFIKRWLRNDKNIHLNCMYTTNEKIGNGYIWGVIEYPELDDKVGLHYTFESALTEGIIETLNIL